MANTGDTRRVWKTRTWYDNWNNVIRNVLFKDEMLLDMMMIPPEDRNNVLTFITRYFVRQGMSDVLITNEQVRIMYADVEGAAMNIPQMSKRYLEFDIYVRDKHLHNYDSDRLRSRHQLIAERIKYLLTRTKFVENMCFTVIDEFDLGTKTIGYDRYHLIVEYKKTH